MKTRTAIIVGGGIGGLAAALALVRVGWSVRVLERASQFSDIGAGIQISPNGMKILLALGVAERLEGDFCAPERLEMRVGRTGKTVFSLPLREVALERWGAPYWHLHRADLVRALAEVLEVRAPGAVQFNAQVRDYTVDGADLSVALMDEHALHGDVLIGADGIHSVVRDQMIGQDAPRFTGHVAWRAVVPVDRLGVHAPETTACVWTGAERHAVTYRLRGGTLANFVGVVAQDTWRDESWLQVGARADALSDFEDFNPVVRTLIEQADTHYRWALFDRPPLSRWSDGPVALLGDAAHPMLPSMAQGAVMAIEDGWVLAHRLATATDIPDALTRYFADRIARTSRVQRMALANLGLFHTESPIAQAVVRAPLSLASRMAPNLLHKRQDWLYGRDLVAEFA